MVIVERERELMAGAGPEVDHSDESERHLKVRAAILHHLQEQQNSGVRWSSGFADPLSEKLDVPPSFVLRTVFALESAGLVELSSDGVRLRSTN